MEICPAICSIIRPTGNLRTCSLQLLCCGIALLLALGNRQLQAQSPSQSFTPNDPAFQAGNQYALDLINAPAAWGYSTGDPRVVVALIDTGIDYTHPELSDHIHPDGRTFFLNGSPQDYDGHGTLTAGIIGAATHNAAGMAGLADNVQILPIKVSPGQLRTTERDQLVAAAVEQAAAIYNFQEPIRYAAHPDRNGTKVININFATSMSAPQEAKAIHEAMQQGVLTVAAAGNSGKDLPLYPAAYDCVLGVGAVNEQAERASFSTYGLGVDVVAPGVGILSTALADQDDGYAYVHGTSFAAPHVAGLAALLFSVRPDLSAWDVREIIMYSARDLGAPGYDSEYGYGLIDAGAALALAGQWIANTGSVLDHCTGQRHKIYGSLYFDENQNGQRDRGERTFSEPYTDTTTFVELYSSNGKALLARTRPNHAGIYTFDVAYSSDEAPYLVKLQNSTVHQTIYFTDSLSGPNDLDMLALQQTAVTIEGSVRVDNLADNRVRSSVASVAQQQQAQPALAPYHYPEQRPTQVALHQLGQRAPVAIATANEAGDFRFYLTTPTTVVTYTLRSVDQPETPQLARAYTLTLTPTCGKAIPLTVALDPASIPVEGQTLPNSAPVELQASYHTNRTVLQWQAALPLRGASVYEIAYAHNRGGPYQPLAVTAFAQTLSHTLYDLPNGDYYFVVRGRTRAATTPELWSPHSNEALVTVSGSNSSRIFLPFIIR